uniref:Cathepsin propeptide inhibitor domain-containing protein n=1 Tax=viral metagenome TaxID=1070528 RepID=A0A6C0K9Z3_9ZZZZ
MLALVVYTATCAYTVLSSPMKMLSQSPYPSFQKWSKVNGRVYQPTERDYRETIYTQNLALMRLTNNSWTNKFADRTAEEFATYLDCVESKSKTNLRGASTLQILNSTNQFETNATVVNSCVQ